MINPIETATVLAKDRTGRATGTSIGNLRLILEQLSLDRSQVKFYEMADLLAEKFPDERLIL